MRPPASSLNLHEYAFAGTRATLCSGLGVLGGNTAREGGYGVRSQLLARFRPRYGLALGLAFGLAALVVYDVSGYGHGMLFLWLAALVTLGIYFWSRSAVLPRIAKIDVALPAGLTLAFIPLYMVGLYRWPVQVSSDEIAVMSTAREYASKAGVDPFGISTYLGRPSGLFVLWGKLADALGGVDLNNVRLVHGAFGLLTIAASYALFRQLLPRGWALFATAFLGFNHAFFMISRLAMRENTAVFLEVTALALLLWGLRRDHPLATFAGGIVAGLGFYVYIPGRAIFPLWVLFLILLAFLSRERFPLRKLAQLGAIALAGFALMAGPVMIAESKIPPETTPQKDALLIYQAGRDLQHEWVPGSSEAGAIAKNIKWGLTAFNNNLPDHQYIYDNRGHGFVDPLTGYLLWIGVGVVVLGLYVGRRDLASLLALGSFVFLWLSFAFVVNKAPAYPRMLIILPFVAYLVAVAVRSLAGFAAFVARELRPALEPYVPIATAVTAIGAIAVWNLAIGWDYVQQGRRSGDPIGSTGRYVASHKNIPGEGFYVAADDTRSYAYFVWGNVEFSYGRIQLFAKDNSQFRGVVSPAGLVNFEAPPPFAIFMRREAWTIGALALADRYPQGRLRNITPDGSLVVLEVPS